MSHVWIPPPSPYNCRRQVFPELRLQPTGCLDDLTMIDARLDAHAFEEVDEILGRDVAGRIRSEWTAACTPYRRIEHGHARRICSCRVRDSGVSRVVEVTTQRHVGDCTNCFDRGGDLRGDGHTDRVTQGNLVGSRTRPTGCKTHNRIDGNDTLVGTAKRDRDRDRGSTIPNLPEHHLDLIHRNLRRNPGIRLIETIRGTDHEGDLVNAGREGPLKTAPIQNQTDV